MNTFLLYLIIAEAAFLVYILKKVYEDNLPTKGKGRVRTMAWIAMNQLSVLLLLIMLPTLPGTVFKMSPLTAGLVGWFNSSVLSGLMNAKKFKFDDDGGDKPLPPDNNKP